MTTAEAEQELKRRQEALRGLYARFRECAEKLGEKSLVRYNKDRVRFEDCIHAACRRVSIKERTAVVVFIKLQRQITDMAILLLELRHSIDCEEAKNKSK